MYNQLPQHDSSVIVATDNGLKYVTRYMVNRTAPLTVTFGTTTLVCA